MKTIQAQYKNGVLSPFSQEDKEKLSSFNDNQILVAKVSGTTKDRSIRQLRLFFACCRVVAENTEDIQWNSVDKVKNQVKVRLQFIDLNKSIVVNGVFHPHYRSINFAELKHIEANKIFDQAFAVMAGFLGVGIQELLANAERNYT